MSTTTSKIKEFREQFLGTINSIVTSEGKVDLVTVLSVLGFISLDLKDRKQRPLIDLLKYSKHNIVLKENEVVNLLSGDQTINNLFKVLCAILNL
jgi:hypothetical protein